jgi:hypothetical protein
MIKEIKFTDNALKQIAIYYLKKIKDHFLESLSKVEDAQVFNMIYHLINQK